MKSGDSLAFRCIQIKPMGRMDEPCKRLTFLDWKLTGWSGVFFGLILAKLFPQLTEVPLFWLALLVVVLLIRPVYVFFISFHRRS